MKENCTIVKKGTDVHYDTNDEKFYSSAWNRTQDTREYLEMLIRNNPAKFKGCIIEENE